MVLSLQLLILALAFPVVLEGTAVELRETTPALVQWALRDQLVKKVMISLQWKEGNIKLER